MRPIVNCNPLPTFPIAFVIMISFSTSSRVLSNRFSISLSTMERGGGIFPYLEVSSTSIKQPNATQEIYRRPSRSLQRLECEGHGPAKRGRPALEMVRDVEYPSWDRLDDSWTQRQVLTCPASSWRGRGALRGRHAGSGTEAQSVLAPARAGFMSTSSPTSSHGGWKK